MKKHLLLSFFIVMCNFIFIMPTGQARIPYSYLNIGGLYAAQPKGSTLVVYGKATANFGVSSHDRIFIK